MLDQIEGLIKLQDNICLSGGAEGADLQWGMNAGRAGQSVIHWSFEKHKCHAPEVETVRLTEDQLSVADPFLARANETLKRRWPASNPYVGNLLRRNYYQIAWAEAVYAVGEMKNGEIQGGTAWATQMYMDRFLRDGTDLTLARLYFYNQATRTWMFWNGIWQTLIGAPPTPAGVWAGIGSRDLQDHGKWAIRELWGWFKPTEDEQLTL